MRLHAPSSLCGYCKNLFFRREGHPHLTKTARFGHIKSYSCDICSAHWKSDITEGWELVTSAVKEESPDNRQSSLQPPIVTEANLLLRNLTLD